MTVAEKRAAFRALHQEGCFVMPNPWDVGSARALQGLGFKAIASTSAGMAWAMGLNDGAVTRGAVLGHLAELAAATRIPLNADFENGFADDPKGVAESVALAVETGVAGLSIEDFTGKADAPLYDFDLAVARIAAARTAIGDSGVVLTARCEGFLRGRPDLDEIIRRLTAYSEAGADCLYAPLLPGEAEIATVVKAVAPKPVNILAAGQPVATLAKLGARRISIGASLARAAWGGFLQAAREIDGSGDFAAAFAPAAKGGEIVGLLTA
jgi:2-methylisocitrate lyase-like PEP mutase family enzyme